MLAGHLSAGHRKCKTVSLAEILRDVQSSELAVACSNTWEATEADKHKSGQEHNDVTHVRLLVLLSTPSKRGREHKPKQGRLITH